MADFMAIAKEVLEPMGFEVLEVVVSKGRVTTTVLVRIDRLDEQPVLLSDLERASDVLSLELDRLDPIPDGYKLELESPGPKRPLLRKRHFERMLGLKAKVKLPQASFIGRIASVSDEEITFEEDNKTRRTVPLAGIRAQLAEWPERHR